VFRLQYHDESHWENVTAKLREVVTQMLCRGCFIPLKPKKLVYVFPSSAASSMAIQRLKLKPRLWQNSLRRRPLLTNSATNTN
jgi:hypothetical protein